MQRVQQYTQRFIFPNAVSFVSSLSLYIISHLLPLLHLPLLPLLVSRQSSLCRRFRRGCAEWRNHLVTSQLFKSSKVVKRGVVNRPDK